jgi:hypothetical protein
VHQERDAKGDHGHPAVKDREQHEGEEDGADDLQGRVGSGLL